MDLIDLSQGINGFADVACGRRACTKYAGMCCLLLTDLADWTRTAAENAAGKHLQRVDQHPVRLMALCSKLCTPEAQWRRAEGER